MAFSEEYYIRAHGEQKGPYTFPQLKQLFDKNFLAEETLYWRDGMEQWQPITDLCGMPAKQRRRKIRIRRMFVGLTLAVLSGAIVLITIVLLPTIKEGWKEMNQREFTAEAAYWKARWFVRDNLREKNATVSFSAFERATVKLSNGTDAMVTLPGTIFPAEGNSTDTTWRVTMKYNPARKEWRLPTSEEAKHAAQQ